MLYVVATPIGNLEDVTPRAKRVLASVGLIAAEDTRRTRRLLSALGIEAKVVAYHAHNERQQTAKLLRHMRDGMEVALVSDAGTPLISDPGLPLVDACFTEGIPVVPVPGASSVMAALCVAGLPASDFAFKGFIPSKAAARKTFLGQLSDQPMTQVFLEAPHRIEASLQDLREAFGAERQATLCRELTKQFEQVTRADLGTLADAVAAGHIPAKGEFVLVVAGAAERQGISLPARQLVEALLGEMPPARVAAVAARLTGEPRNALYQLVRELTGQSS